AGLGDRVERRVQDRVAHHAAHDVVLAPVDLAPLHAARLHPSVDVTRERVERLVVVVVPVERQVPEGIEIRHAASVPGAPSRRTGVTEYAQDLLNDATSGVGEVPNDHASNENYVVISTDCHAGGSLDQYREYLPAKWHDDFDAWRGAYKNPFRDLSGSKRYRNWDSEARLHEMEADGIV